MKRPWYIIIAALTAILSIVVSACSQASPPPTTTTTPPPKTSAAPLPATTTAPAATTKPAATTPSAAKPQYGGTLNMPLAADIVNWDSGLNGNGGALLDLVYNQNMESDWTRGPAGTKVSNFAAGASNTDDSSYPMIMESWSMTSPGVWVMNVRKGIHWQNVNTEAGKLVGPRELTVDDVIFNFNYILKQPRSWANVSQPAISKVTTIEKTGPWQVTIRIPLDYLTSWTWFVQGGGSARMYPPEVIQKYGDMGDWHNAVGTGPFILTDYVKGSSLTFVKNPDYWEPNPVGPGKGDKLPYVDGVKQIIISDLSTRMTAFRTGKIDIIDGNAALNSADAQPMLKANPQIQSTKYITQFPWAITMRTDKMDQPFANTPNGLKVRQALMMATDFNALSQTLFAGDAEIDVWPVSKFLPNMYTPLSQMPQAVQDLYVYNPTKAKQMLADAGYPNGFTTSIVASSVDQTKIDDLTAFKAMWAKVGVTLNIDIRDNAVYTSIMQGRSNDQMLYRSIFALWAQQMYFSPQRGPTTANASFINDPPGSIPEIEAIFQKINTQIFVDWPGAFATYKTLKPIILSGAWYITRPTPYTYNVYWPYVQNYYGQNAASFVRYLWLDQAQKKAMGF